MRKTINLEQAIQQWDGKSAEDISCIYDGYAGFTDFVSSTIALIKKEGSQKGASWLLKRHLENEQQLEPKQTAQLWALLSDLGCWETKLHLLQSLPYLKIGNNGKQKVEHFLRCCLSDNNKFVRAWAYHGFYELSLQYPEYQEETKRFFALAMKDEAASVKARIRNILKKGF